MALEVDITKRLWDFTLRVRFRTDGPQEVLALLGPSGCGKSMTLKCIAGIERPDAGRIVLDGRVLFDAEKGIDLPPQRRRVGYLFQSYALFPNMTVLGNVMAGAAGSTRDERARRAAEALRRMRLGGLEGRRPAELSGGQQQRCAMARILASRPDLILLDEPFSALDGYLRWQLEMELADVLHEFPGGTVFVSHNRDEVYRLCDTVCVVSQGASDPRCTVRELFEAPRTLAAALISGCKNVSRASCVGEGLLRCDDWGVELRTALPCADATHAGIRAHYLHVGEAGCQNALPCEVDRVIDSTFSTIVMARTPGGALLRYELAKDEWAGMAAEAASGRIVLSVEPTDVMPLVEGGARGEGKRC